MMKNKRMILMGLCLCLFLLTACQQGTAPATAPTDTAGTCAWETILAETPALPSAAQESGGHPAESEAATEESKEETPEESSPESPEESTAETSKPITETADNTEKTEIAETAETLETAGPSASAETVISADLSHLPPISPQMGKTEMENGWYESFNEGEVTPCQVEGYSERSGSFASYFPQPGDRIAVLAPSTLSSWGAVNAVIKGLQSWGYVPVPGQYVLVPERSLRNCIDDMVWALTDPSIRGVFCVRGGYGASEVMDAIPLQMVREANKPIIGYSDISVFHAAWSVAGLPSIHGAMNRNFTDLAADCVAVMQNMMTGQRPRYHCAGFEENLPGSAEGILVGGNLSTVTAVLNTEYDCTALEEPYILFFEDVDTDFEQVHRLLTVLKHQGVLDKAKGIVFGEWINAPAESETADGSSRGGAYRSMANMIRRSFFPEADIPIAFGFPAGHGNINYPLLMGEKVRLQVGGEGVSLEWMD